MKYEKEQFSRTSLNVFDLKAGDDIFYLFPNLSKIEGFANYVDEDKNIALILKYIVYVYDNESPYIEIDNIVLRKRTVLTDIGLIRSTSNISAKAELIIFNRNIGVCRMVIDYLRTFKYSKWSSLITYEDALAMQQYELISNKSGSEIKYTLNNIDMITKAISEMKANLLCNDDNSDINDLLHEEVLYESLRLRPEDIAKRIFDNEKIKL